MDKDMEVTQEGGILTIRIKMKDPFEVSGSGKSMVVASSHGNVRTDCMVDGKPLTIGLNAYISNKKVV